MTKAPKISVVMPVYNGQAYLQEAIESILNQTYKNFEFIIVDDNSTDRSFEIITKYKKLDKRIKVYKNKKNLGIAKTRNYGLAKAEGKYYAPMDNDDISDLRRLEKELLFLESHNSYAAVGSQVKVINENGKLIGHRDYKQTHKKIMKAIGIVSPMCNPSSMIRISHLRHFGQFDERFPGTEDYDMWFKLATKYKLANLSKYLFSYRISSRQAKSKQTKKLLNYSQKIQKEWIFRKPFLNTKAIFLHYIRYLLFLIPGRLILYLFSKININYTSAKNLNLSS